MKSFIVAFIFVFLTGYPAIVLAQSTSSERGAGAMQEGVNGIENAVDRAENVVDNVERGINHAPQTVQETIADVIDREAVQDVGEAIGVYNDVQGLVGRILGLGQQIKGILSNFNLSRLLDLLNLNLEDIWASVYNSGSQGGSNGSGDANNVGGSRPDAEQTLAQTATGELGLPVLDAADQAIDRAGTSPLSEFLGIKQQGGSFVDKHYLKNTLRTALVEQVADATALSSEGQKKLAENTEVANDALKLSSAMQEDSEGQDVSQNILRNVSSQLQAQQQTDTLLAVDAQLRARDDSLRNVLLSETLLEVQGDRLRNHRQDASAYSGVITQGGQFILPGLFEEVENER